MRTFDTVNNRCGRYTVRLAGNLPAKKDAGRDIAGRKINCPARITGVPEAH